MELNNQKCLICGGDLRPNFGGKYQCSYCGKQYSNEEIEGLVETERSLASARKKLYDAINDKRVNGRYIHECCITIKRLQPNDFQASFFDAAISSNPQNVVKAIRGIDVEKHYVYLESVIKFLIRILQSEFILETDSLIGRAYKNIEPDKYDEYSALLAFKAEKVESATRAKREMAARARMVIRGQAHGETDNFRVSIPNNTFMEDIEPEVVEKTEPDQAEVPDAEETIPETEELAEIEPEESIEPDGIASEYEENADAEPEESIAEYDEVDMPDYDGTSEWESYNDYSNAAADDYDDEEASFSVKGSGEQRFRQFARKNTVVGGTLSKYREDSFDTEIPEGITVIGLGAFNSNKHLTRVVMPSSVTRLDKEAFWNCKYLKNLHLSDSLELIGEEAFWGCYELEQVELPDSLKRIGKRAFKYCENLAEIKIPSGVKRINEGTFQGCSSLKKLSLPSSLEQIDKQAFCDCKSLSEIKLPETVQKIQEFAFMGCGNLREIEIPVGVSFIGEGAFDGCINLKKVRLSRTLELPDKLFAKDVEIEYV